MNTRLRETYNKWILLCTDNPMLGELMHLQIRKYAKLVTAKTYEDCRENVLKYNFDLIIMDIHLPGEKPLEKAKHIREIVDVPIIAYVDYYEDFRNSSELSAYFDDFIEKPVSKQKLHAVINALIEG